MKCWIESEKCKRLTFERKICKGGCQHRPRPLIFLTSSIKVAPICVGNAIFKLRRTNVKLMRNKNYQEYSSGFLINVIGSQYQCPKGIDLKQLKLNQEYKKGFIWSCPFQMNMSFPNLELKMKYPEWGLEPGPHPLKAPNQLAVVCVLSGHLDGVNPLPGRYAGQCNQWPLIVNFKYLCPRQWLIYALTWLQMHLSALNLLGQISWYGDFCADLNILLH